MFARLDRSRRHPDRPISRHHRNEQRYRRDTLKKADDSPSIWSPLQIQIAKVDCGLPRPQSTPCLLGEFAFFHHNQPSAQCEVGAWGRTVDAAGTPA